MYSIKTIVLIEYIYLKLLSIFYVFCYYRSMNPHTITSFGFFPNGVRGSNEYINNIITNEQIIIKIEKS